MAGRYRIPPGVLSYVKLHLYPPDGSSPTCKDPYITIPEFTARFSPKRHRNGFNAIMSVPEHLVRKALKQLVDDGFLKWRILPKQDSEGDPLVLVYPLPDIIVPLNVPSSLSNECALRGGYWYRTNRYVPGKGFEPGFFYDRTIVWKSGKWVHNFHDNWWSMLFKRSGRPKKRHIDKLRKQVPELSPDWDGKGYEILTKEKPYVEFGTEHSLRMNPLDEEYSTAELCDIWQNLKFRRFLHPCPFCGVPINFKHTQRSKKARHAAKLHKPTCDLAVVSEVHNG